MRLIKYLILILTLLVEISEATELHWSSAERASLKTLSFQGAANIADSLIFGGITGADAPTSVLFFIANSASASAVYFPYELAWDNYGPQEITANNLMVKTSIYQIITTMRNLALSYAFSGTLLSSLDFTVAAIALDTTLYVTNEYLWAFFSRH